MTVDRQLARPLQQPLFLAWEERQRRLKRDPRTIKNFRQAARRLEDYLADLGVTPENVEPWQLEEYFEQLDLAPSTKRRHLVSIRAAYAYAVKRGAITRDPTYIVDIERVPDEEPTVIPNDELRAMKERIWTPRANLLFHLLAYTGMRRHEIQKLIWADIRLEEGTIRVVGKGGKLRLVPIHPALGEQLAWAQRAHNPAPDDYVLASRVRGAAVGNHTFGQILDEFTTEYTAHDFRRTAASSLAYNGVSDGVIDKIMGWAPRSVGRRYYIKVAGPELQRGILRLYADDPV